MVSQLSGSWPHHISNPIFGLMLGLLSKFTFLRLKVAYELLNNFQNFNF